MYFRYENLDIVTSMIWIFWYVEVRILRSNPLNPTKNNTMSGS